MVLTRYVSGSLTMTNQSCPIVLGKCGGDKLSATSLTSFKDASGYCDENKNDL